MDTQTHIQHGALSSTQCVYVALVTVRLTPLRDLQPRQTRPVWQRAEGVAYCGTARSFVFFFLTTKLLRNHGPCDPWPDPEWPLETPQENGKKGAVCFARVNNLKDIPKVKIDVFVCLCLWCHLISRTRRTSRCFCIGLLTTMATNVFEKFQIMQNTQF